MKTGLVIFVLAFIVTHASGVPIVSLTVKERAGVARVNEPVLTGVPLPESLFVDTAVFALKDASGNVVPCEFRRAARWWRDKQSIRWLHLDFQTSLNASEEKTFVLHNEPTSHPVSGSNLAVTDLGTKFQVTTGPLRFTVKKQNFNLFDEAWIDESGGQAFDAAHQVVSSHNKGFSLLTGGVRYYSSNDASTAVTVQRRGPMAVVLKATGRLKNPGGTARYYFVCRIYAYNNSKIVKVVFSFENRQNADSNDGTQSSWSHVKMSGLNVELPLNLSTKNFVLGAKTAHTTGTVTGSETAYLYVSAIDAYEYGGNASGSGNTRYDQSVDMGWASLSDGSKGCAMGIRWFWQNYPASIEVNGAGELNGGLFSHRVSAPWEIYAGMSKTHEIRFVFYNTGTANDVRKQVAGVNKRLYAVAAPVWYCRATHAFGKLTEKDNPSLYDAARWTQVSDIEARMRNGALKCIGNTNAMLGGKDAYDYLGWGDNPHFLQAMGELMWNGNYYDLPHMFLHHFARTGDFMFLDYALPHISHIQDLHIVHFEPNDFRDGSNRYCPPMNHIGHDDLPPWIEGHGSHHKTQGLFEKYYLIGEDRALDVAFKGHKCAKSWGDGMASGSHLSTSRRLGHAFLTLTMGYKHTLASGDYTIILNNHNRLRSTIGSGGVPGQGWMAGLMLEGLLDAYLTTDVDLMTATIKQCLDNTSNTNANSGLAYAFTGRHYNQLSYLNTANSRILTMGTGVAFNHQEKDYAEQCRSVLRALYYFAIPDSANHKPLAVEKSVVTGSEGMVLKVYPNPFKAAITFQVQSKMQNAECKMQIYNAQGKQVHSAERIISGVYVWDAAGLPSGMYFVRAAAGGRTLQKKVILMK